MSSYCHDANNLHDIVKDWYNDKVLEKSDFDRYDHLHESFWELQQQISTNNNHGGHNGHNVTIQPTGPVAAPSGPLLNNKSNGSGQRRRSIEDHSQLVNHQLVNGDQRGPNNVHSNLQDVPEIMSRDNGGNGVYVDQNTPNTNLLVSEKREKRPSWEQGIWV